MRHENASDERRAAMKESKLVPVLLVVCIAIVVAWEVLANRSRRPFSAFVGGGSEVARFAPQAPGWSIERIEAASDDPSAPNIVAFLVRRTEVPGGSGGAAPVLVRLVHGYNMPDCMRLKGYKVELLKDEGGGMKDGRGGTKDEFQRTTNSRRPALSNSETQVSGLIPHPSGLPRVQVWRLTSDIGDVSVACSAMIRATDFGGTTVDVRDMAFPRISSPIGPEWDLVGFRLSSLRHPMKSLVMLFKVKWNNSRCDLLTFLKLRQPAWASSDLLTFLATSRDVRVTPGEESRAISDVRAAQMVICAELIRWNSTERAGTRRE